MNRILEFEPKEGWVRVQPGMILDSLNKFLKPHNLFFPIDPSTKEYCTLGGMIANNSSGPHAVKYGATRDYILSLEVVLSDGEVMTTRPVSSERGESKDPETLRRESIGPCLACSTVSQTSEGRKAFHPEKFLRL
jgi:FAD/FMN-containing dehydrogenase